MHCPQPSADAVGRETDLYCLLYCSVAVEAMSQAVLESLLDQGRRNNRRDHVAGLLLYHSGCFMQVIEGGEATIQRLFETIRVDVRHTAVEVCMEGSIDRRAFGTWCMAFRELGEMDLGGCRSLLEIGANYSAADQPSRMLRLMRSFLEPRR